MLLHVTLAAAPGGSLPGGPGPGMPLELVIKIMPNTAGAGVAARLAERYGQARYSIRGIQVEELTPGVAPFVNGAVILRAPAGAETAPVAGAAASVPLLLAACSGPDAGRVTALRRGRHTIGRLGPETPEPRIGIADPALSRDHAEVLVGAESVTIRDLGSANGTWVDGRRVRTAAVTEGSNIRLGYSSFRLQIPGTVHEAPAPPGNPFEPLTVRLAEHGQKTGLLLLAALLPLVLGVVLALATGMWMFLAFSAISALTALITAAGSRRRRRQQAADIAQAALADGERRSLAAPDPGTVALAAETGSSTETTSGGSAVRPIRIGSGQQAANLQVVPPQPRFVPPQIPEAPVILHLGQDPDIRLEGPPREIRALVRTILVQASAVSGLQVFCIGARSELEPDARFLPGVCLVALPHPSTPGTGISTAVRRLEPLLMDRSGQAAGPPGIVLLVCPSWAGRTEELVAGLAGDLRQHISVIRIGGPPAPIGVSVLGGRGQLEAGGSSFAFVPDLIQRTTFGRLSRALATGAPSLRDAEVQAPPPTAAFDECHSVSPELLIHAWQSSPRSTGAVIGVAASGPVSLDLEKDGPHFLVAGTTGSGKSEFLRTFIAALAVSLPPTAVTFLLIDFKGGSGLGPVAALPHTVGLLTDFSAENVARALVSLRAELRRRETLLAHAGADNLTAYNSTRPGFHELPRLLVVIDEFRMLSEEVPTALPELLRIAAVGRSLGLHLLLATQRPQGAVTTDIRANISTSIALRVQSATESRDIINTDAAAAIPPGLPGRAFLSRGGLAPVAFQSLSTSLRTGSGDSAVMELHEHLLLDTANSAAALPEDPAALHRLVADVREAAAAGGYPTPFNPVQDPLPSLLTRDLLAAAADDSAEAPPGLRLGLLDDPGQQRRRTLSWDPVIHSHLALLGSKRSGAPDALCLVAAKHLYSNPGRHLYVLDADGDLSFLAAAEQTGAYVGPGDTRRAARVLAYLASQALQRLASSTASPDGTTLLVTGWGRWSADFRSGHGFSAEDDLAALIRDGERADMCVVLAGDREVLNARFFPLVPNRMFFPADASAETLLTWPRLPQMDRIRLRALVQGRCGTAEGLAAQLLAPEPPFRPEHLPPLPPGSPRPHRIDNLPALVAPGALRPPLATDRFAVGVSGDELDTASIRLPPRSVFLVAGPRGSGRTSFLHQIMRSAENSVHCCLTAGPADLEPALALLDQRENLQDSLFLVDEADSLPLSFHHKLAEAQNHGARIVLAAAPGHLLTARVPLLAQIRSAPHGALLRPAAQADGDIFGLRVEAGVRRPPGRCYLIDGSDVTEAQIAFAPAAGDGSPPVPA